MSSLHARSTVALALAAGLLSMLLLLAGPIMAQTADCTVTSTADSGPNTLRQCIADAPAGGLIDFDLTYPATITLTSAQLTIDKDLTIDGPGAENVAVSGNDAYRVIYIDTGYAVSIDGLTIRDGYIDSVEGGAGIAAGGPLTITHCIIQSNSADFTGLTVQDKGLNLNTDRGSRVHADHPHTAASSRTDDRAASKDEDAHSLTSQPPVSISATGDVPGGGGLAFSGGEGAYTLTVQYAQFISNTAHMVGGGASIAEAWVDLSDSTFQGNESSGAMEYGGGLSIVDSVFQFDNDHRHREFGHRGRRPVVLGRNR